VDSERFNSNLSAISASVSHLRMPALEPLRERLTGLEVSLNNLRLPEIEMGPLNQKLADLESAVSTVYSSVTAMRMPDLQATERRLARLEDAVKAIDVPDIDLASLHSRFARLEQAITAARSEIGAQPGFDVLERRMASLQEAIMGIGQPDLTPVIRSVRSIDSRLDLGAVENRLNAIEYGLAALHHMLRSRPDPMALAAGQAEPRFYANGGPGERGNIAGSGAPVTGQTTQSFAPPSPEPYAMPRTQFPSQPASPPASGAYSSVRGGDPIDSVRRPGDQANLLAEPAFGQGDDLEQIHGIGPMLSELLNDIGVYYFWQIAEWTPEQVAWVDSQLMHFKGRIDRDNWVGQARNLMAMPSSARRPAPGDDNRFS